MTDHTLLIFTEGYTTLWCVYRQMNTNTTKSFLHMWRCSWSPVFSCRHVTQIVLQSPLKAPSLPEDLCHVSVLPVAPLPRCTDVLLLWQAQWNWQHDLYSSTNMHGNINSHGMAGKCTPGNIHECVLSNFRFNWWAVCIRWVQHLTQETSVTLMAAISSEIAAIVLCIHTREIKEMKALFLYFWRGFFCFFYSVLPLV